MRQEPEFEEAFDLFSTSTIKVPREEVEAARRADVAQLKAAWRMGDVSREQLPEGIDLTYSFGIDIFAHAISFYERKLFAVDWVLHDGRELTPRTKKGLMYWLDEAPVLQVRPRPLPFKPVPTLVPMPQFKPSTTPYCAPKGDLVLPPFAPGLPAFTSPEYLKLRGKYES